MGPRTSTMCGASMRYFTGVAMHISKMADRPSTHPSQMTQRMQ